LLLAAIVFPSLGFPQITQASSQTEDYDSPTAAPRVEIPFKLYLNYLILAKGSLGALEQLNFLIDTGANTSAVNRRIAKKLGLKGVSAKLALFDQRVDIEKVVLPSIQLGPIRVESLQGLIQDLSPVESFLGIRIDAVVGFDVLSRESFVINYESKRIIFGPIEPSPLSVPIHTGPVTFTVELLVQGKPVHLVVDTGTAGLLLFECQLPDGLRLLPTRGVKRLFNSVGTESELKEVWLLETRLGVADFGVERALLVNDDVTRGRSFDGLVGPASLGLKWIAFDFERRRFGWRK
jgi:predicted aspartyl protease